MSNSFSVVYNRDGVFIFYKSSLENKTKHLQNDHEEYDVFVWWFYAVISLVSLKKKEKQKVKKLFIYFWVIENV